MPDAIMEEVQAYINKIYGIQPQDRVFGFTDMPLRKNMAKYSEKAGIPRIRIHDIRYPNLNKIQTFQRKYENYNKYRLKKFGFYFWCMILL